MSNRSKRNGSVWNGSASVYIGLGTVLSSSVNGLLVSSFLERFFWCFFWDPQYVRFSTTGPRYSIFLQKQNKIQNLCKIGPVCHHFLYLLSESNFYLLFLAAVLVEIPIAQYVQAEILHA